MALGHSIAVELTASIIVRSMTTRNLKSSLRPSYGIGSQRIGMTGREKQESRSWIATIRRWLADYFARRSGNGPAGTDEGGRAILLVTVPVTVEIE